MTPAEQWLRAHTGDAPAVLLEAMVAALPRAASPVPDVLAEAALGLFAQVVGREGGRQDALPLLAADALLAHAFAAQVVLDPAGVPGLAERWGATGRLAGLGRR